MHHHQQTLTVSEAAELCGVGHSTVGYWVREKNLAALRVGRGYQISIPELMVFLKTRAGKRVKLKASVFALAEPNNAKLVLGETL